MEPNVDWLVAARAIAVAEMALILGLLLKQRDSTLALRLGQLFVVCVISYLLSDAYRPESVTEQPPFLWYALISVAMAIPALYWALARTVFIDDFRWGKKEWWVIGLYELTSISFLGLDYFWHFALGRTHVGFMGFPLLMRIALSVWTLYIVLESWRSDLMESRRRLRLLAALIIGGYTLATLMFELSGINSPREAPILLLHTAGIAVIGFLVLLSLGQLNITALYLLADDKPKDGEVTPADSNIASSSDETDTQIANWEEQLSRIRGERLYALENMTIAKLAELLSVPEYRLRKQIVQSTQYKNFNQFLNHFRVEEAASRLISEQDQKLPIVSIALDVGFRSLPSFNRSFKERFMMTPSEYRKSAVGKAH